MNKLLTLFLLISAYNITLAQNSGRWTLSGSISYAQPSGTLNSFFKASEIYGFELGQFTQEDLLWELKLEVIKFDKPNLNKLNPLINDISLNLDIYGASAQATYYPFDVTNWWRPYITGSLGVYRWYYKRGGHYAIGEANSIDTTHYVNPFNLSDWSAGFSLGGGIDFKVIYNLTVYTDIRYNIIVGEIWQTLSLDLDNVSSMQMGTFNIGIRYRL